LANSETPGARKVTAAGRYMSLETYRDPFLRRARDAARLTIPGIMPEDGHSGSTTLYQPYQSVGADGVNNLTAKILLVLFPPGEPFVRHAVDDFVAEEIARKAGDNQEAFRAKIEEALGKIDRALMTKMERVGARKTLNEAIAHAIVTGNGLLHITPEFKFLFYGLDKYVLKRDSEGNVIDIVVKQCLSRATLPKKVREIVEGKTSDDPELKKDETVELYTWIYRDPDGDGFKAHQEVMDEVVPGTKHSYPPGKCPWIPIRWVQVSGEDYGRGRVEEYLGDLISLEEASKAIVTFGAIASKAVALVNEGGTTDKEALAEADPGDIIDGNAEDVTWLQVEKAYDFQTVAAIAENCLKRLQKAFLMGDSVTRDAERVTAEEIRMVFNELQQGLGGVYSQQAEELQRPIAEVMTWQMAKNGELPKLPDDTVSPQIVTGLDGLGRSNDLQRLDMLLVGIVEQFGPEVVSQWINVGDYIVRRAAALGIDTSGLVRTAEEVAAAQQQANMMSLAEKGVGPGLNLVGKLATEQNRQEAPEGGSA